MLPSHRYVRRQLIVDNRFDRYDLELRRSGLPPESTAEYWTNGKTTLLELKPPAPAGISTMNSKIKEASSSSTRSNSASDDSKGNTRNSIVRSSLLAGSVAGMASTLACHPFDVLRVKMQSAALASSSSSTVGLTGTIRHTVQYGGVRALYTGLTMPLGAQAIYKATVFTVNNLTQKLIIDWKTLENYKLGHFQEHRLNMMDRFACGFMGGAVNGALFVAPVEYVRNNVINASSSAVENVASKGPSSYARVSPLSVIRNTISRDGFLGLWKGTASTVLRDSMGCGCFFVAMAKTQELLKEDDGYLSKSSVVLSGATAGVSFWLWALPVDCWKTWIQSGKARDLSHAMELSRKDGLKSLSLLFRGWQVAYGRGAPAAAITVTTYSLAYRYLSSTDTE